MAINEACQVWIEQRVKEELDAGKSYRAIGREIAAEIERVFQTEVKPGTIFQKARRKDADTNVSGGPTPQDQPDKLGKEDVEVVRPQCTCGNLAEPKRKKGEFFPQCQTCRKTKKASPPQAPAGDNIDPSYSLSMRYAEVAISQLTQINVRGKGAEAAFLHVINWIYDRMEKVPIETTVE